MNCFAPLHLSGFQARTLGQVYSDGRVVTEPLFNRLTQTAAGRALASLGLHLLPAPRPVVHFGFEGNRPYGMTAVGNGEAFGLLSWETTHDGSAPTVGPMRLELVQQASLPFLTVATPPDDGAVQRAMVGLIAFCLAGWRALPEGPEKTMGREGMEAFLTASPKAQALRDALFEGGDPAVVLSELFEPAPGLRTTNVSLFRPLKS